MLYQLVPLPLGPLAGLDLVSRAVLGAIYDRIRLSNYSLTGGNAQFYDPSEGACYCLYSLEELSALIGVSTRTIKRALQLLREDNLILSQRTYSGANRYFIHEGIMDYLRSPQ